MKYTEYSIVYLCFGDCFWTAHENKQHNRIADYEKIIRALFRQAVPPSKVAPVAPSRYDAIFWFGDLNFRLDTSSETVLRQAIKEHISYKERKRNRTRCKIHNSWHPSPVVNEASSVLDMFRIDANFIHLKMAIDIVDT